MSIRSFSLLLYFLIAFSVLTSIIALRSFVVPSGVSIPHCMDGGLCYFGNAHSFGLVHTFVKQSPFLASGGWCLVGVMSLWYKRTTSSWRKMGIDSDIFRLMMQMRGGPTRIRLLRSLTAPKNRLELSRELGYDWNVIDRHTRILLKYGMLEETSVYGSVKLFQLTGTGKKLVQLIEELQEAEMRL
ncbi:MAG: hypothetical protein M1587_03525 [Thaumarchaeota archaeon]|nr:hypothetical protein [Nitrososphaerota archaeon]MCL5067592.1 hypothetical protein [Nitrososphaerota archaeon]